MNLKNVGTIIGKDIRQGMRSSMFIFVLVSPFIYTFLIGMIFGGFLGEGRPPTLGVVDLGNSELVPLMSDFEGLNTRIYASESRMQTAIENNVVDGGIVLAVDFDETLLSGDSPNLEIRFSGKSYASNRLNIQNTLTKLVREMAGQEVPVEINTTVLGSEKALALRDRTTPFIFLAVIMISGFFLTSLGIVEEREERTISAVSVTPVTITEFIASKAILGYVMAIVATTLTFIMNGVTDPTYLSLLMPFLFLGGLFAVSVGVIFGTLMDNSTELLGMAKGINFLLFAPALVILFPSIPQWIAKFVPTYYIIYPIMQISMLGVGWSEVWQEFIILVGVVIVTAGIALYLIDKKKNELYTT
jgi:ABC-2 type transport system permease protein